MGPRFPNALTTAITCLALGLSRVAAAAEIPLSVTYLGNEGVLIEQGETRILVDPLFRLDHPYYQAVPDHIENAIVAGEPPFDGVSAVMITHHHLDHFSPNLVLNFLTLNPSVKLYAPEQAVKYLQQFSAAQDEGVLDRITGLYLSHYGEPFEQRSNGMTLEILRIPHSGWPDGERGTQNQVYRITLADGSTVVHLGDSAASFELFDRFRDFWAARRNDLVLAPYWFQQSREGKRILSELLKAGATVGIHVPAGVPEDPQKRPAEYRDLTLLVTPGSKYLLPQAR